MRILLLTFGSIFLSVVGIAQYYNPYYSAEANRQAYEWGRQMAEQQAAQQAEANRKAFEWGQQIARQQIAQEEGRDAKTVNGCLTRIGNAIGRRSFSNAKEWARKLHKLNKEMGNYYLGLVYELDGYTTTAKKYYTLGANAGNQSCKAELKRIEKCGYATKKQKDNVVNYFRQIEALSYNMASQITNEIWGSSNSSSSYISTNSSRASQKASCSTCRGTGYDLTPYTHSASPDSYHHTSGECAYCGRVTNHYHYRCMH